MSHSAECVSGMYQILQCMSELDRNDYAVLVGIERMTGLRNWVMSLLGTIGNSLPFSKNRTGIRLQDCAYCLILEDEEKAKARGATIHGYLHRPHVATDGSQSKFTDPSPIGFRKSMVNALQGVKLNDLAFVNAHATGTPLGDPNEYELIDELAPYVPITSYKGKIGHSLTCATISETIYTIVALSRGIIPRTYTQQCDFDNVMLCNTFTNKKLALKNSLAFGGKSGSMIIEVD